MLGWNANKPVSRPEGLKVSYVLHQGGKHAAALHEKSTFPSNSPDSTKHTSKDG